MMIEEWDDNHFMPYSQAPTNKTTVMHRKRQRLFYDQCMRKLKHDGRKWVLMVDVDEFLIFNVHTETPNATVDQPGVILSFLNKELTKSDTKLQKGACTILPRLRYGSKESAMEKVIKQVPHGSNASSFQTLRIRNHAPLEIFVHNRRPKTIIDLTRVKDSEIHVVDVHRPIQNACPQAPKHSRKFMSQTVP